MRGARHHGGRHEGDDGLSHCVFSWSMKGARRERLNATGAKMGFCMRAARHHGERHERG